MKNKSKRYHNLIKHRLFEELIDTQTKIVKIIILTLLFILFYFVSEEKVTQ